MDKTKTCRIDHIFTKNINNEDLQSYIYFKITDN